MADPTKYAEAIAAWRERVPMTDPEFHALDEAQRVRAFWVAGVAQADMVQDVYDAIARAIADGTTLDDFRRQVGEMLTGAWGGAQPHRIETIFRTNVMTAYNAGRHAVMTAPSVLRARPYWRFDAVRDNRISPICEELNGTIRPASDPFWRTHTPPLHHACRSVLTPLNGDDVRDEGGLSDRKRPTNAPADGFGRAPTTRGADWTPDLTRYDPKLRRAVRSKLDDA